MTLPIDIVNNLVSGKTVGESLIGITNDGFGNTDNGTTYINYVGDGGAKFPSSGIVKTVTIPVDAHFSFSTGATVTSGGDMFYQVVWGYGTATTSLLGNGVSGNFGSSYADFANWVSNPSYLPPAEDWWGSEGVYSDDGTFDARGVWTRWFKTTENKYAIVFVQAADSTSITIQYVYPYGTFSF